jgi:hypothetical protein
VGIGLAAILQMNVGPRRAFRLPIAVDVMDGSSEAASPTCTEEAAPLQFSAE